MAGHRVRGAGAGGAAGGGAEHPGADHDPGRGGRGGEARGEGVGVTLVILSLHLVTRPAGGDSDLRAAGRLLRWLQRHRGPGGRQHQPGLRQHLQGDSSNIQRKM